MRENWKMRGIAAAALLAVTALRGAAADEPSAKTYKNPLLSGRTMADPHVLRHDGKYYLYPTSRHEGYEAFTSDDLVHWKNQGLVFRDPRGGCWAPDVFHSSRGGKFYLYYTDTMPDTKPPLNKQVGVAVADGPLGPFQDQRVLFRDAIDAHLFEDTDGKLYLYYVQLKGGFCIRVQPMADPLTAVGEAIDLIRPTEPWECISGRVTEGPFMIKRGDTYYLTYSGTGADSPNYGIGYATAKSPTGPFKKYAGNPIVKRSGDLLGPGHHSIVRGPRGDLWMVYHQKWNDQTNFDRFLAIDRTWFDESGVLHAQATKGTEQAAP